jgi:xylitol oxidase
MGVPGPWHERLPHFRPEFTPSAGEELQSEWLLPRESAPEVMAVIRGLGDRIAPLLHISEIRTVRSDDLWLSPAQGRDSVAFHFTWYKNPDAVLPVVAELDAKLMPLGARPHWGKVTTAAPSDIVAAYPHVADFARLVRTLDPEGKFRNRFVDALV